MGLFFSWKCSSLLGCFRSINAFRDFIVFTCNAKSFTIAILVFFSFFSFSFSSLFVEGHSKDFRSMFYSSLTRKHVTKVGFISLDTLKIVSVKLFPLVAIRDTCGTWYGLLMITSVPAIRKSTRNSQKFGDKLARRWQKILESKDRNRVAQ